MITIGGNNSPGGSGYTAYTAAVDGSRIKKARLCNKNEATKTISFYYEDNTVIRNPPDTIFNYADCDSAQSYFVPSSGDFQGPIRGLAFQRTNRVSGSEWNIEYRTWSFYIENSGCSSTQIPS